MAPLRFARLGATAFVEHLVPRLEVDSAEQAVLLAKSNLDFGWGRLFGGQAVAQSLAAACATVPASRPAYALSCTFLREGLLDETLRFEVEKTRDGRSFSSRRVRALQSRGLVLDMLVNFHEEESGELWEHQTAEGPAALREEDPDALGPNRRRVEQFAAERGRASVDEVLPRLLQNIYLDETQPVVLRPGLVLDVLGKDPPRDPEFHSWIRGGDGLAEAAETAGAPLSAAHVAQVALAFASDFGFLGTALFPHGVNVWQPVVQPASLVHTMHFHAPVPLDRWLLFSTHSPWAGGARGLVRGEIYERDSGRLLVSATQEGLLRPRTRKRSPDAVSYFS